MRYLLIFALLFPLFFSCSSSGTDNDEWIDLTYHYQTGSIPPPYYYEYDIIIKNNGEGRINYYPDYGNDSTGSWGYNIKLSKDKLELLSDELNRSRIMRKKISKLSNDKIPIGGALQNIHINITKNISVATPYFPADIKQTAELEKIYELIKSFVSDDIWNDIDIRKKNFIEERQK